MTVTNSPVMSKKAISIARAALVELDEGRVGRYLGVDTHNKDQGNNIATHRFAADIPGYRGWEWVAVVVCAPGSRYITISELALLPGSQALRAPRWVPYEERIQPGDLLPGYIMPPRKNDPRLEKDGEKIILSTRGKKSTIKRWEAGDFSPSSESAQKSAHNCVDCAFYIDISDRIEGKWGVCANEFSADGHVVNADYGCGAHSLTKNPAEEKAEPMVPFDDFGY